MRRTCEDAIRRNRTHMGTWLKYAAFEAGIGEYARARSIYERAIDVDPRTPTLWLRYAEMEMKQGNMNLARNIWDRAVTILPRMDQFWYKYVYLEEQLGNIEGAREIYERWMSWEPEAAIWASYVKFEKRHGNWDRARAIFQRLVRVHSNSEAWLKWARFEEKAPVTDEAAAKIGKFDRARQVYEKASEIPSVLCPSFLVEFAKFEVRAGEIERARAIYQFALDRFPKDQAEGLYHSYAQFERQHGDTAAILAVTAMKRRTIYENWVEAAPYDYDGWFEYVWMEEELVSAASVTPLPLSKEDGIALVREVYERAIAQIPPVMEKRAWRRYIYLWLGYATFEEAVVGDSDRALAVYEAAIRMIPHGNFTFAKVWLGLAHLHLRRLDVAAARKTMGLALGQCPKPRLFKGYIEMELRLREFDRCRTIYQRFLSYDPASASTWTRFAEMEKLLGEDERARLIYEIAIDPQQQLDLPELVWKAYIDFEFEGERYDAVRALYERLIGRTEHVKVWVSYANFEVALDSLEEELSEEEHIASRKTSGIQRARAILTRANNTLKLSNQVSERILLLEAWRQLELQHGDQPSIEAITRIQPRRIRKRRRKQMMNGATDEIEVEEYIEYAFPEDAVDSVENSATGHEKLLEMAQRWKAAVKQ